MSVESIQAKLDVHRQNVISELDAYIAKLTTIRNGVDNYIINHWDDRIEDILEEARSNTMLDGLVEDSTSSSL